MSARIDGRAAAHCDYIKMGPEEIFLTDEEFEALFGADIAGLIRDLNKMSRQKCRECGGKCCQEAGCRLYSPMFTGCPIYEIRPRECRYHFCHQIFAEAPLDREQKEMLTRPVTEFTRGNREEILRMFPSFPNFPTSEEGLVSLGIREAVAHIMQALEQGELSQGTAWALLGNICRRC